MKLSNTSLPPFSLLPFIVSLTFCACSTPNDNNMNVMQVPPRDTASSGSDFIVPVDTATDTAAGLPLGDACDVGGYTCVNNQLLNCPAGTWVHNANCNEDFARCSTFGATLGMCLVEVLRPTSIRINKIKSDVIAPAGVRTVFYVEKDNGMPVGRLTASEIEIINNETGKPFSEGGGSPAILPPGDISFYTILTLDMSDSMFTPVNDNNAMRAVAAAKLFVQNRVELALENTKHHVAIYAFGSTVQSGLVQEFTNDHQLLYQELDALLTSGSRGGTNLYGAYLASLNELSEIVAETMFVSSSMILLSDGLHEAGDKEQLRASALNLLQNTETNVYAIGMAGEYDETELKELTSNPTTNYFSKDSRLTLDETFTQIAKMSQALADSNYVVGVCTPVETASSFAINIRKDGLSGTLQVTYEPPMECDAAPCWTGDISRCTESAIANPCANIECGPISIPEMFCGTCPAATPYCVDNACTNTPPVDTDSDTDSDTSSDTNPGT